MGDILLQMIAVCLLLTIPFIFNLKYPLYTFSFLSFAIILLTVFKKRFHYFSATYFLIAYIIILLPFLAVNGFLTALPVVKYNDLQNLGIRITTIPVEDIFYGMLLILMNVVLYEKLQDRFEKKTG